MKLSFLPNSPSLRRSLVPLSLLLFSLLLASCKSDQQPSVEKVKEELSKLYQQTHEAIQGVTPAVQSLTTEQLEKLFIFEYQIMEVAADSPTSDIERRLQAFGRERWECYFVEHSGNSTRFYLKRRPATYLRYVPRWFP